MSAAKALARFASQIERDIGNHGFDRAVGQQISRQNCLRHGQARGFAVLGQAEAAEFLAEKPVEFIYGVGAVNAAKLAADGFKLIADYNGRRTRSDAPLWCGRRQALAD